MHISIVRVWSGREEEVTRESERTLTDRWSQHAVCFDGWGTESVNIHGPLPPPLSAASARPRVDEFQGNFPIAFMKG